MKELVAEFNQNLKAAVKIASEARLASPIRKPENVIVLGLGGSGIGGTIASQVLSQVLDVPMTACKDYILPNFVGEKTLVIASSYSGNTEETLSALEQARKKNAMIYCVCSGGKMADLAARHHDPCILIPPGFPPRAAFGYSFPQLFRILEAAELLNADYRQWLQDSIALLESNEHAMREEAMKIAAVLRDKTTVIYSSTDYEGVAIRFRQQINENAKKLCWHHALPEMNHNELVGWREENDNLAVVFLHSEDDHQRTVRRMELTEEVIKKYTPHVVHIQSLGKNRLERSLYLIHFCDWISVFIAELNEMDSIEVNIITYLKGELAKM